MSPQESPREHEYDVALSFAGEDRGYVEAVADAAVALGLRIFYDRYEETGLWGKDLYEHLDWVYRKAAKYCVLFISKSYAEKVWTNHERSSAQARAIEQNTEYVLPVRFDDTEVPGLRPTIGYIDLAGRDPADLARSIREKVGEPARTNFLPPHLDRLYERMGIEEDDAAIELTDHRVSLLFGNLTRMRPEEREVLAAVLVRGCAADLPDNVHINVDLLSRLVERSATEVLQILGGLRSLGVVSTLYEDHSHGGDELGGPGQMVRVEIRLMFRGEAGGNATELLRNMIWNQGLCEHHSVAALVDADFAHLSHATLREGSIHD